MPTLDNAKISGYRSFGAEQTFEPAIPDGQCVGSGLTFVVGPNNSGKSALLEAIDLCSRTEDSLLTKDSRNRQTLYQTRLTCNWTDGRSVTLKSDPLNPGAVFAPEDRKDVREHRVIYIPDIPRIPRQMESKPSEGITDLLNQPFAQMRNPQNSVLMKRISKWFEPQSEAVELFRKIVDFDVKFFAESTYLNVQISGSEHIPEGLGSGIATIAHIVDAIYELPPNTTIMIDEPEQRLHPVYQRKLLRVLAEKARQLQVIICTHSPYMIDWSALQAGAALVRISKSVQNSSRIHKLSKESITAVSTFLADTFNPHVFGTNATEFLFLPEKVILVEGQEDVVYLRRGLEQCGIPIDAEFYGWGVGGAEKIKLVARILHELGFENVVGVLDSDKEKVAVELSTEFPQFRFIVLPTEDIRDKVAVSKPAKTGLFRRNGAIDSKDIQLLERIGAAISDALRGKTLSAEPVVIRKEV